MSEVRLIGNLPEEGKSLEALDEKFRALCHESAVNAIMFMFEVKGASRDVGVKLWQRMTFGDMSFAHELGKKTSRVASDLRAGHVGKAGESIEEQIDDIINYAVSWRAWRTMWKEKENENTEGEESRDL